MSQLVLEPHLADTGVGEESKEGKYDFQSSTWRGIKIDENKMVALGGVIEDIVNGKDDLPDQLIEAAKAISEMSSGINWLNNYKEDFKQIIGRASILVVVLWKSHKKSKYRSLGWPPKLRMGINDLMDTIHRIHKLMKRKFKNFAQRILEGYFVRDLGKFKKYQRRLNAVASVLESKPSNIKINEVLLEVLDNRAQHHHEDTELSKQPAGGNLPVKQDTQKRTDIQEPTAEGSNSQRKTTAAKPANLNVIFEGEGDEDVEVDQTGSKALGRDKVGNKTNNDSEAQRVEEHERSTEDKSTKKKVTRRRPEDQIVAPSELKATKRKKKDNKPDEDVPRSKGKGKRKQTAVEPDEDVEEGTSGQGFWNNEAAPSNPHEASEDEESNEDIPVNDPITTKVPLKNRKPVMTPKPNVRSQTVPAQSSISGFSFNNHGSGTMTNRDIGNIYNSTISDVGNDNSVNYFQPRRKPTYYGHQ